MTEPLYTIWGKVRAGKKRGKKLGYPTANIALHKNIPEGIYVSQTKVRSALYPSITFIGAARTFDEREVLLETHIFSFNESIYSEYISVQLLEKLRNNRRFDSQEALVQQMERDTISAKEFFKLT